MPMTINSFDAYTEKVAYNKQKTKEKMYVSLKRPDMSYLHYKLRLMFYSRYGRVCDREHNKAVRMVLKVYIHLFRGSHISLLVDAGFSVRFKI